MHQIDPAHRFDLDGLVGCVLVQWSDGWFSVLDVANESLGYGEDEQEALWEARRTIARRKGPDS